MYIYYVLRGSRNEQTIEFEGDIDEEHFPGVNPREALEVIEAIIQKLGAEGTTAEWSACDLTDAFFDHEDNYIYFHNRWIRRSDAPWRKDRNN